MRFQGKVVWVTGASSGIGEAVAVATEMKQYAKTLTGSAWAVDRRTAP